MAKAKEKNEQTSKRIASLAGKVLKQKTSTKAAKQLAGSALTQYRNKPVRGGRRK